MRLRTCIGRAYQRFFLASKSSAGATQSAAVVAATSSGFCFDNTAHNRTDRQMKGGKEATRQGRREGKTGWVQTYKTGVARQARDRHMKRETVGKQEQKAICKLSIIPGRSQLVQVALCSKKEENTSQPNYEKQKRISTWLCLNMPRQQIIQTLKHHFIFQPKTTWQTVDTDIYEKNAIKNTA